MSSPERRPLPPPVEDPEKIASVDESEPDFSDPKEIYRRRIDVALERIDKEDLGKEIERLEKELGINLEEPIEKATKGGAANKPSEE